VSISALLLFPVAFLRSFAYAGYGVLAVAVAAAVLVMPAALAALGAERVAGQSRRPSNADGFWYRAARRVMGRAVPVTLNFGVTGSLVPLGAVISSSSMPSQFGAVSAATAQIFCLVLASV
jgi:RND superfamily putative drug exporter